MHPKIGSIVYGVHKQYITDKLQGGKVLPCRIIGYENVQGEVQPMLRVVGSKYAPVGYQIFTDLEKAIKAITTKKK